MTTFYIIDLLGAIASLVSLGIALARPQKFDGRPLTTAQATRRRINATLTTALVVGYVLAFCLISNPHNTGLWVVAAILIPLLVSVGIALNVGVAALAIRVIRSTMRSPLRQTSHAVPRIVFIVMEPRDAQRYSCEWGAHLFELIADGEFRQARRDRRRMVSAAVAIAVAVRVRRAFGRAR